MPLPGLSWVWETLGTRLHLSKGWEERSQEHKQTKGCIFQQYKLKHDSVVSKITCTGLMSEKYRKARIAGDDKNGYRLVSQVISIKKQTSANLTGTK